MTPIVIGKSGGRNAGIDLKLLLRTRGLVTANSGGGKSWLLRRMAEQLFGKVPVWITDPEGEFASLRERHGFVLVGKGGETPADPRSAALVVQRLREQRASAIFDLYELKPHVRHAFVRAMFEALMNLPKNLWFPLIVKLDEAQVFAPEKGTGDSEASGSVQDVATRGRKRGICLIAYTQRLSNISKGVTAELLNRIVGMTREDVDIERGLRVLSVTRAESEEFAHGLKKLAPGQFYALGPAISNDRILVEVGPVATSHPEVGEEIASTPPPTPASIKHLLPKLSDLPKEAEEKAKTETDLRAEIRTLKAQLAARVPAVPARPAAAPPPREVEKPVLHAKDLVLAERVMRELATVAASVEGAAANIRSHSDSLRDRFAEVDRKLKSNGAAARGADRSATPVGQRVAKTAPTPPAVSRPSPASADDGTPLKAGERKMLQVLAQRQGEQTTHAILGVLANFAAGGGTFGNYVRTLKRRGFAIEHGDTIAATEDGIAYLAGDVPAAPQTTDELVEMWKRALKAGERTMLDILVRAGGEPITHEQLGAESNFAAGGGTYGNYLRTLKRCGLAVEDDGHVRAAEALFIGGSR